MKRRTKIGIIAGIILVVVLAVIGIGRVFFGASGTGSQLETFIVSRNATQAEMVVKLKAQGFIKNETAFKFILFLKREIIQPGGYKIAKNMTAWQLAGKLSQPDMKWVVIPEGYRKEQIGELLQKTFGWNSDELKKWDTVYTDTDPDYTEGVYFPDTYLIPVGESGQAIAKRMTNQFNAEFVPYLPQFAAQNIKWTTGLKLASIIQREAAGANDMPLIAGILWNRLAQEMPLQVDATVQYARGNTGAGWWAPISAADIIKIDSPYNTYEHAGLPPAPICNPGVAAIEAVLYPEKTDCLYYLHDSKRQIHCAKTYQEQQDNVAKYLKN
ncbi:MAG: endolytic transglycosylase MltG [Candidatus Pacebacteria bacterium]|nr:endolytic transglycosylase MltG [Candidatus Paceibacterota bacterium]MDR3583518.1 endolytic transglycosylase MltG [Candidatus Paceibacterota bacterium]